MQTINAVVLWRAFWRNSCQNRASIKYESTIVGTWTEIYWLLKSSNQIYSSAGNTWDIRQRFGHFIEITKRQIISKNFNQFENILKIEHFVNLIGEVVFSYLLCLRPLSPYYWCWHQHFSEDEYKLLIWPPRIFLSLGSTAKYSSFELHFCDTITKYYLMRHQQIITFSTIDYTIETKNEYTDHRNKCQKE